MLLFQYNKTASILLGLFLFLNLNGQLLYRIEGDFSIMEKSTNGTENLMMGRVYFDKVKRQIVSDIKFPQREILIINDTAVIKALSGTYKEQELGTALIDFSVLNLFLNGDLDYFGLKNTPFVLTEVEQDEDMVISTWIFDNNMANGNYQKMLLSQKKNKLYGLITYGSNENIISKQVFTNYIEINGMHFPTKSIQISFTPDGEEYKKITEYSNIKVNNTSNDSFYHYNYSAFKP